MKQETATLESTPRRRLVKILRGTVMVIAVLLTLLALVWTEENWRGRRDWEKFRQAAEARGERLDLASYIAAPVSPEKNFYATPLLEPLLDFEIVDGKVRWADSNGVARAKSLGKISGAALGLEKADLKAAQKHFLGNTNFPTPPKGQTPAADVLFAMKPLEPMLAELYNAVQRPAAVFSQHPDRDLPAMMTVFEIFKSMTQAGCLRALAHLESGDSTNALIDVQFLFGTANILRGEPLLISQMVRAAILNIALVPVKKGLAEYRWSEPQLVELQQLLGGEDLLQDYAAAMRGERAFANEIMTHYIAGNYEVLGQKQPGFKWLGVFSPRGLLYQNQIALNLLTDDFSLKVVDLASRRVYPERSTKEAFEAALGRHTPYNIFARLTTPALQKVSLQCAYLQSAVDQASLVCALERSRLADGRFPETLEALVPKFCAAIPRDVIGGGALHYQRKADGMFLLYSVGWNGVDDGGVLGPVKDGKPDREQGDWVWYAK
ncbi:MAG: hypothetical protein U1F65_03155 [Verrucomicrobiota bacterium]